MRRLPCYCGSPLLPLLPLLLLLLLQLQLHSLTAASTQGRAVGSRCEASSDCHHVANSTCTGGLCSCRPGFVQATDRGSCLPQVVGRSCLPAGSVCDFAHSHCDNGVCACARPGFVPAFNKTVCLPVVEAVLEGCDEDSQCQGGAVGLDSVCLDRRCRCRFGPSVRGRACDARKALDDWCSHSQQCLSIGRASCVQGRCACDPYFVPDLASRAECIPVGTRVGAACRLQVQCQAALGDGGRCGQDGRCACAPGFHWVLNTTGACLPDRGLYERCSTDDECWLPLDPRTACREGVCLCRPGLEPTDGNQRCAGGAAAVALSALVLLPVALARATLGC